MEIRLGEGPQGAWRWWPLRLLFLFVALTLVYAGCQVAGQILPGRVPRVPPGVVDLGIALAGALVVAAMYRWLVLWTERRRTIELGSDGWPGGALRGALIGLALFSTVYGSLAVLGVASVQGWNNASGLAGALAMSLLSGVGEEILFRGVVFRLVEEGTGTLVALVASGAFFGLLHAGNRGATWASTAAIAVEAGILLAAAYTMTRSLWLPMGLHFGWNFAEGGIFGASVSGGAAHGLLRTQLSGPDWLTGGAFGPEASIVAVALCFVVALVMIGATIRRGHWNPMVFRLRAVPRSAPPDVQTPDASS